VIFPALMGTPRGAHRSGLKPDLEQGIGFEHGVPPRFERTAQPRGERNGESTLRAIDERERHVSSQQVSQ